MEQAITPKTKLIVPVHMLGNPCDMDKINEIAKRHGIPVLEDGCEAFGGFYKGKPVGSLGDISVFSFDFAKTITTGEGGCIFTNDRFLDKRMREFHDHGHESNLTQSLSRGLIQRMSELQAAVGQAQLKKLSIIRDGNLTNKKAIKDALISEKVQGLEFRRITDTNELADTLIFNFPEVEQTNEVVKRLGELGVPTKKFTDALDWHFSGKWNHMFVDVPRYKKSWPVEWSRTADLLGDQFQFQLCALGSQPN